MESKTNPVIIVQVSRPELSPEEKAERMAEIKRAATGLVMATMRKQRTAV